MSSNKFNNNERHQGPCILGSAVGVRELVPDPAQGRWQGPQPVLYSEVQGQQSLGERVSGEVQSAAQSAQTDFGWSVLVLPKKVVPPEQWAPDPISHPALATASCPPDSKGAWPGLQAPPSFRDHLCAQCAPGVQTQGGEGSPNFWQEDQISGFSAVFLAFNFPLRC